MMVVAPAPEAPLPANAAALLVLFEMKKVPVDVDPVVAAANPLAP
jgi:hypothetical protein